MVITSIEEIYDWRPPRLRTLAVEANYLMYRAQQLKCGAGRHVSLRERRKLKHHGLKLAAEIAVYLERHNAWIALGNLSCGPSLKDPADTRWWTAPDRTLRWRW